MCYYAVYMRLVSRVSSKVWLAERAAISPTNLITDMFMPVAGLGGPRDPPTSGGSPPRLGPPAVRLICNPTTPPGLQGSSAGAWPSTLLI